MNDLDAIPANRPQSPAPLVSGIREQVDAWRRGRQPDHGGPRRVVGIAPQAALLASLTNPALLAVLVAQARMIAVVIAAGPRPALTS